MAFDIENSPLWLDVKKVMYGDTEIPCNIYQVKVHTEKEDISVIKMITMGITKDYTAANTDFTYVKFIMPMGDYVLKLYPFRDNLEVSIRTIDVKSEGAPKQVDAGEEVDIRRYKAIFSTDNPGVSEEIVKSDLHTMNNSDVLEITLQLVELQAAPLMISRITGNHNDKAPATMIREVLTAGTANIEVEGKPCIESIDIYKPNNTEKVRNVIVPDGTHLTEFPRILQEQTCGVYTSGLGSYFQNYDGAMRWFIYPLFEPKRFDEGEGRRLILYDIPKNRYEGIRRTYLVDGDVISVLITSGRQYKDNPKNTDLNEGGGFKMLDARVVMAKAAVIGSDGSVKGSRTQTTHEVMYEDRKDGLNYTKMLPTSSNPFAVYSAINMRRKAEQIVQWQFADHTLIYPGMPVKYVFDDGEDIVEVYGSLGGADVSVDTATKDYKETPYSVTVNLRLYVEMVQAPKEADTSSTTYGSF